MWSIYNIPRSIKNCSQRCASCSEQRTHSISDMGDDDHSGGCCHVTLTSSTRRCSYRHYVVEEDIVGVCVELLGLQLSNGRKDFVQIIQLRQNLLQDQLIAEQQARIFLMIILGGVLFTTTKKDNVSLIYCHCSQIYHKLHTIIEVKLCWQSHTMACVRHLRLTLQNYLDVLT